MNVSDYLRFARRWLPIAFVLAALLSAGTYAATRVAIRPLYTATTTMQVQLAMSGTAALTDPVLNAEYAQTESAVAQEAPTISHAIAEAVQHYPGRVTLSESRQTANSVACRTSIQTSLFSCSATSHLPAFAADVANDLASFFIKSEHRWDQSRYQQVLARIVAQEKAALRSHDLTHYNNLVALETNVRVGAAQNAANLRIVAPATVPNNPSSPHPTLNALLAFFIVFALVLGGGALLESLNDSLRNDEELKELTGLPILGFIPYIAALKDKGKTGETLVTANQPRSGAAESFRVVRTNVAFTRMDDPVRSLLVTSAFQDEGKSTVAANLAAAFAESGKRTILVDLDLHRPAVARIFDAPRQGLTNLLLQPEGDVEDFLIPTALPNLQVLPSGPLPPNPSEQISSPRMREIMRRLTSIAELVVVDSPPILALADAAIVASLCDGAIIVARPDRLHRRAVKRVMEIVLGANMRALGIVVNSVAAKSDSYYYSYYSYYGYHYQYGPDKMTRGKNGHARESADRAEVKR